MANVTLSSNWDLRSFRSGISEMKAEVGRFNETFKKGIESGGGLFGSIDKAFGKLATGRLAAPMAAVGAAMTVAKVASEGISKYWDNVASATERALQNIQAIESTRAAVLDASRSGDALTEAQRIQQRGRQGAAASAAAEAAAIGDPSTDAGRKRLSKELGGGGLSGFYHYLTLTAGAYGIVFGGAYDAANQLYQQRQQRAQETRQEADRAEQLRPFVEYQNRSQQNAADSAYWSARERIDVAQGRTTSYEAASYAFLRAHNQYQNTRDAFGDEDTRTIQAKASVLDAFGSYDREITQARRYRNDPTISADSLARIGGGGGVNVFGNGRGELVFSQDRLTKSIEQLTPAVRDLGQTLSRTASTGGRGSDITR